MGRLTKDPEVRYTQSDNSTCIASFTIAVDRRFKGEQTADFISCVAWNQGAEFLATYAHKGDAIGVTGKINTRSYDGQNGKVYVTEVVCNRVVIAGQKRENNNRPAQEQSAAPKEEYATEDDFLCSPTGMAMLDASILRLQIIGESVRAIDDMTKGELLSKYDAIPWRSIIGLRNIISHDYANVNYTIIVKIIKNNLLLLDETVAKMISDLS